MFAQFQQEMFNGSLEFPIIKKSVSHNKMSMYALLLPVLNTESPFLNTSNKIFFEVAALSEAYLLLKPCY